MNPKMTNSLTMFKLETMIYVSEDGTSSVFTLNPDLQKQLAALAAEHPEMCCQKAKSEKRENVYCLNKAICITLDIE